jgi:hypothetical protein
MIIYGFNALKAGAFRLDLKAVDLNLSHEN